MFDVILFCLLRSSEFSDSPMFFDQRQGLDEETCRCVGSYNGAILFMVKKPPEAKYVVISNLLIVRNIYFEFHFGCYFGIFCLASCLLSFVLCFFLSMSWGCLSMFSPIFLVYNWGVLICKIG